jgi:DNA-binding IclR family transcriptional regulator
MMGSHETFGSSPRSPSVERILEELQEETGFTISLGALSDASVVYIWRHNARHDTDGDIQTGTHVPIYCTALGKALLATVDDQWRRRVISRIDFTPAGPQSIPTHREFAAELSRLDPTKPVIADEEFIAGTRAIALAVPRSGHERLIGVEISAPSHACTIERMNNELGPHLQYAVKLISQARSTRSD